MNQILNFFIHNSGFTNSLAIIGVILFSYFLTSYVYKSWRLKGQLGKYIREIEALGEIDECEKRNRFDELFKSSKHYLVWSEFSETLHNQDDISGAEVVVKKTRSTMPSQIFFSQQNIIDTPLSVEFFKHLPGILTGLGIIGTFYGLITGLAGFDTSDPQKINDSLTFLLNSVSHAFYFSAGAIALAIMVTILEKVLLERCIYNLDQLTQLIDKQFDAGVGEEYLSELVKLSAEGTHYAKTLNESLINDLKVMLANLLEEQAKQNIEIADKVAASIGSSISATIENSFKAPLEQIAKSVSSASGDQGKQVSNILEQLLVSLTEKLESTIGKQMDDTVASLREMQGGFSQLIQKMEESNVSSASLIQEKLVSTIEDMKKGQSDMQQIMSEITQQGESANTKMGEQLKALFDESELRQQKMADQSQMFIDSINENFNKGQQETMDKVYDSVTQIESKFEGIFGSFKTARKDMDKESLLAQTALHDQTESVMTNISDQMNSLLTTLEQERKATREIVDSLGEVTQQALVKMQLGAEKMGMSAEKFTLAGNNMSDVTVKIEDVMKTVGQSTTDITNGLNNLSKMIEDYKKLRDSVQQTFISIEGVVKSSQTETINRQQLIDDLKTVCLEMKKNNTEANQYFENINNVLEESFTKFTKGVVDSVGTSIHLLDDNLASSIGRIDVGFDDFSNYLDDLLDRLDGGERSPKKLTKEN